MTSKEWYHKVYLRSNYWKRRREEKLKQDDYTCVLCGNKDKLVIHHLNYYNLWSELDSDLQTLCKACHFKQHNWKTVQKQFVDMIDVPEFTRDGHYKLWLLLCQNHIGYCTNILYYNRDKEKYPITNATDIQELLNCGRTTAYRFLKECISGGYIAEFNYKEQKYLVVNPNYMSFGNMMPQILSNLFDEDA